MDFIYMQLRFNSDGDQVICHQGRGTEIAQKIKIVVTHIYDH
jgi:hypothetical protein